MHICLGTTPTVQQTMQFTHFTPNEVNRAAAVTRHASGKPINVARVLHTLGEFVCAIVPLGGQLGNLAREDLQKSDIDFAGPTVAAETRLCVTVIENNTATELIEESNPLAESETDALLAILLGRIPRCISLILSGSLAPNVAPDFYAKCCQIAAKAAKPVILDARGPELLAALEHRPLIVKPNLAELASTLQIKIVTDADLRRAIATLHDRGAQNVVITRGPRGCVLSDAQHLWQIPALQIPLVSPIGSGDAFAAGLAAGLSRQLDLPAAAKLATAAAAANAMMPGAGFLSLDDVQSLQPRVQLEPF